jgi:hypothetical protein
MKWFWIALIVVAFAFYKSMSEPWVLIDPATGRRAV